VASRLGWLWGNVAAGYKTLSYGLRVPPAVFIDLQVEIAK
jgi:hypothetical protein